jgi:serine/threonine-protein kinase HipA
MRVLDVKFHGLAGGAPLKAGRIAYRDRRCFFEYDAAFLERGVNLSPTNLKWMPGLQESTREPFNGLHGIFNDSLPDGWGLMLMDRAVRAAGRDPRSMTPIDRLAFIGNRAMGALSYEPDDGAAFETNPVVPMDLQRVGSESTAIFEGTMDEVLEHHSIHGTPSGGARPKILVGLSEDGGQAVTGAEDLPAGYTHWLAKFPTGSNPAQQAEGRLEYVYYLMAKNAGIQMMPCRLYSPENGPAYFLTKRFDRLDGNRRVHMHTLAGLVHANFRSPDFEYGELMKLTAGLTRSYAEKTELFRRLAFNVLCGNRDDHTKNFAFMLDQQRKWVSSPAYDLSFSGGASGEHSMSVNGKGKNITEEDLLAVAEQGSISKAHARMAIGEVADAVTGWGRLSQEQDIPSTQRLEVSNYIEDRLSDICLSPSSGPAPKGGCG